MKKILYIFVFLISLFMINIQTFKAAEDYSWIDNYCTVDYNANGYANITACSFNSATSLKKVSVPALIEYNNQTYTVNIAGKLFFNSKYIEEVTVKRGVKLSTGEQLFKNTNIKKIKFENNIDTSDLTNMSFMFDNSYLLEKVDLGNLDISRVTDMSSFIRQTKLKEFDFSNLNNSSVTNMESFYNSATLEKVKLGKNFNFHISDRVNGTPFGRGTWVREEDGKEFSAVEIAYNTKDKDMSGTYRKISDVSYEIYPKYLTTYRILIDKPYEFVSKSDGSKYGFIKDASNNTNYIYYEVDKVNGNYVVNSNDSITVKIPDVVYDVDGNKYDYEMTIDNLVFGEDMMARVTTDKAYFTISSHGKNLIFYNDMFATIEDLKNDKPSLYNPSSNVKFDVTYKVVDKDGNPVEGSYLFSTYDIDIYAVGDTKNPSLVNPSAGYGLHSEGINLYDSGSFDFSTFQTAKTISFLDTTENLSPDIPLRVTGSRYDCGSEASEFLIKANSKYAKVQYTFGGGAGLSISAYYQPKIVRIENRNDKNEVLIDSKFIINDYDGKTVGEWLTTDTPKSFMLNPGKYIITQVSVKDGYKLAEDKVFFVDTLDRITIDGVSTTDDLITIYNSKKSDEVVPTKEDEKKDDTAKIIVPNKNEEKKEIIENPNTGAMISIISLGILSIVGTFFILKSRKNNKFRKI